MEPVRVKVYGLVSFTRRRYLGQLTAAGLGMLALLLLWWWRWPALRGAFEQASGRLGAWARALGDNLPWVLLGAALVQVVEALVVLRTFARKEARARQEQAPSTPTVEQP
jgi:hypothetical protein